MIAAILIAFREGLEAALIIGIVFGYLRKTGQTVHYHQAWLGVGAAIAASVLLAAGIQIIGAELEGPAEPIFEGTMMFLAVGVLTWMVFWMRYQSRTLKSSLERELQHAITDKQGRGLMAVTFLAVFREGIETALFLSAAVFAAPGIQTLLGALSGLAIAVLVGYLIYLSTVRLNLRVFFSVTSIVLLVFAAGLFAQGIHEFQEVGLIFAQAHPLWNTSALIADDSTLGQLLHAAVGYNSSPSLAEVIGYFAYWGAALVGVRWLVERKVTRTPAAPLQTPVKA